MTDEDNRPVFVMPLEARRRAGILMHPVDIMNIYRERYLSPVDPSELFGLQLAYQDAQNNKEELSKQRKAAVKIRHDMLEAEKRAKALEFAQAIKIAVKEEKPVEQEKEEERPVDAPLIVAPSRRRKKRIPIY